MRFTLIVFLLSSNFCFTQVKEIFVPAKITNINGDTLRGYIKDNDEIRMAQGVLFKENIASQPRIILSKEIRSLKINENEIYDQLKHKSIITGTINHILAKKIVHGFASLYKYIFEYKSFFSIVKPDSAYILQDDELISGNLKRNYFQNNLKHALNNQSGNIESFDDTKFNEKTLVKLVTKFNLRNGYSNLEIKSENRKESFVIANIGGMIKGFENVKFASLIYRVYFPNINKNTSLNIGLTYFKNKQLEISPWITSGINIITDKFYYYRNYVSIPISIQHNFFSKNIRPYIFAGVSVYYDLNKRTDFNFGRKINGQINYGGGVELNISKNILLKTEIRSKQESNLVLIGFGVILPTTKK
jgi:hypothetical protein